MAKKQKSKLIFYIIILLILVALGLFLKKQSSRDDAPANIENWMEEQAESKTQVLSMSSKDIKEENFSGKVTYITGDSILAKSAQGYIDQTVAEFKKQADIDVPDMREKFGADAPMANYTIDISNSLITSEETKSIVLSEYMYTGGANGNSLYKVFTASEKTGKILSLSDVIKKEKQSALTDLVKKSLIAWRPEGSTSSVVFEDEVKSLTFSSFTNWSMDDKNLILYFDKYEIGPGVLGPVAFPLEFSKIKSFLE